MRVSWARLDTRHAFLALLYCDIVKEAGSFLAIPSRISTTRISPRRCRVMIQLGMTPPGKPGSSSAAAADENGNGLGDESRRITRAPMRITPNFQPRDEHHPKYDATRDQDGVFLTDQGFEITSMAWAEFSDWLRRTVERNVDDGPFEFDTRQWFGSIRKWWSRIVEMDVQAKADLLRLYERGMQGRDIRGNKAVKVDARVEEEWDSIYVECQDDSGAGRKGTETANAKLRRNAMRDAVRSERAVGEAYASPSDPGTESRGPTSEVLFLGDFMDGLGEEMDGKGVMQGAETEDGDQGEMKGSSERQGNARDTDPDEGDDIIDCAIRGRWSFTDNDDQKLILSEKARTKHHGEGGAGGMAGMMGGRRGVDGGEASDDDEGEGDMRPREGRGRPGAKEKKKGTWRRGKLILTNEEEDQNKYRDRAEERRKGHNPDYADKLNQMASMDAETSKYLGGDVEHTHLVKGLDYALLVKIRDEERERLRQQMEMDDDIIDGRGGDRRGSFKADLRARTLMGKTVLAVLRRLYQGQASGGPDFKRIGYEFDLEADSTQEIPTAVAHSVGDEDRGGEEEDRERHCNYLMKEDLLEKVQTAFTLFRQHGGKSRRYRKRAREKTSTNEEEDAIVAALAKGKKDRRDEDEDEDVNDEIDERTGLPTPRRPKVSINIFEDVDDRYLPPGSAASGHPLSTAAAVGGKGYFSGLRATKAGNASDRIASDLPSRAEMSATVKAAARAAAARLAGDKTVGSVSTNGGGVGGEPMEGEKRIERDIFAARPSRGQALGVAAGGYDVYPETGDFETYDSDEDTHKKDSMGDVGVGGGGGGGGGVGGGGGGGGRRGGDDPDKHPAFEKPKASFPFGVKKSEMSARKGGGSKGGDKHRMDNKLNMINKYMKGTQ